MKKVFYRGNIDSFNKHIKEFRRNGESFKVYRSGLTRKIITPTKTFRFFGKDTNNYIKGCWNTNRVKKCIDSYIDKYGVPKRFDKPHIQVFNTNAISQNLNKAVGCIDVNACYWTTAMMLGYIDEHTYRVGLEEGNKMGLLVSIGSLNKKPFIEEYQSGKKTISYVDDSKYKRYSPFYWKIIGYTRDVFCKIYEELGDDMYMWITDCVFFDVKHKKKVKDILTEFGYKSKFYVSDFTYCDGHIVKWFDCKEGNEKKMSAYGREIENEYQMYKLFHSYNIE